MSIITDLRSCILWSVAEAGTQLFPPRAEYQTVRHTTRFTTKPSPQLLCMASNFILLSTATLLAGMSPSLLTDAFRFPTSAFYISSINVNLHETSRRHIEYVELRIGNRTLAIRHISIPSKSLNETFSPGIEVSNDEQCLVSVHCCHRVIGLQKRSVVDFSFVPQDVAFRAHVVDEGRALRMVDGKLQILVNVSETPHRPEIGQLIPISDGILRACPRFRLLVMGNDGAGTSSLIGHAFKIRSMKFYEACQRQAGIDTELIFQENDKVVLHHSGPPEMGTQDGIAGFLSRCRNMLDLKDRVHAIWLCLSIPHANERLLDDNTERFIRSKKQLLPDIPIIIVFTKLDLLIDRVEGEAFEAGEDLEPSLLEERIRDEVDKSCIQPLKTIAGEDIPSIAISVAEGYESTVEQLLESTAGKVDRHVANEAALAAAMAQRANISLKLNSSISVGKKRYWRGLASASKFLGFTFKDCLHVIHTDVVAGWNFEDPGRYLISDQFKTLMLNMVTNLDTRDLLEPDTESIGFGDCVTSAIAGIRGPAVHVVLPIAASHTLVGWAYDTFQYSHPVLLQTIAYIVDLMAIMQILFLLIPQGHVTIQAIKLAITAYSMSGINEVHSSIRDYYASPQNMPTIGSRDLPLEMVIQLIKETSIKSEELTALRARIGDLTKLQRDDPRHVWDDDDE